MIPRVVRAVRDWVCVLGALALAVGVAGCGGPGVGAASPSPTPTFLTQETMCEVVPSRILVEKMSFRTTDYAFEHHTSTGENGANTDTFICNLNGRQGSMTATFRIRIAYWPGATLNASSPTPSATWTTNHPTTTCSRSPSTTSRAADTSGSPTVTERSPRPGSTPTTTPWRSSSSPTEKPTTPTTRTTSRP